MKLRYVILSLLASVTLSGYALTDKEVIDFIKKQSAAGKTEQQIGTELMAMGVTPEQAQRIKTQYNKDKEQQGDNRLNSTESTTGTIYGDDDRQPSYFSDRSNDRPKMATPTTADEEAPALGQSQRQVYGRSVFNSRALTFEPNENIATPQNYHLGPGDEVVIDIWGASEDHLRQVISPEGSIMITQLGPVYLNGLTIDDAAKHIRKSFAQKYAGVGDSETEIQVTLGKVRTIQVNLMGEVATPGTYRLSPFATVFHALYRAGGINDIGSMRNIQVLRNNKKIAGIDIYDYLFEGKTDGNIRLQEGDVIIVPPYGSLVNIEGNVRRPMYYEVKPGETVKNVIDYAGGFTSEAFADMISLARQSGNENQLFNISNDQFPTYALQDGDVLTVGTILNRVANRVEIQGAVFRPGIYALDNNVSTVKQLIKKGEGLTENAYLGRALLYREGNELQPQVMSINLTNLIAGIAPDIELKRNDILIIYTIDELKEIGDVTINGRVANPGSYPYAENLTLQDLIFQAGGLLEGASTVRVDVARRLTSPTATSQTRQLSKIYTVSIEGQLNVDAGDGFVLMPYDEVFIRTSPGYEPQRQVSINGEVLFAGEYVLEKRNERLSDVIARAGGLLEGAYIEGAHMTRRLSEDEYLARQEAMRLARANSQGNQNDSIALSKIEVSPDYNVGINLKLALEKPGSAYDVVLQPGDAIYIPEQQSTVKISGDVMFPNTVVYEPGKKLKHYINQAGGYGQRAKKNKAYIVYLNGTVSKAGRNTVIEPGSQIIVPSKPEARSSNMEKIITLATTFSSVATLAAAVASLIRL